MTRKALGRGLSALLGDDIKIDGEELIEINIDNIKPNAEQPRSTFTESKLNELAQSIRTNGVVQPIIVRRQDKSYQIVAGERRWRAAQIAGLITIPAIVKNVTDDKILEIAIIENIQRQELNAIEEATAYKKLIETIGLTQELVANRVGKDRTFVTNYLRLLKLPSRVQKYVAEEKISAGHARAILGVADAAKQQELAEKVIELNLSVRETERTVKRINTGNIKENGQRAIKPKQDANLKAAEAKLRRYFGTQVRIIPDGRATGGRIEIEYYGEEDLNRIYQLMMGN